MDDQACVRFLQWALPRLQMQWRGFRKVRRQVCRRIQLRLHELGLTDCTAYAAYLQAHAEEWPVLARLCRVTISRFYRDRGVFQQLEREVLPRLVDRAHQRSDACLYAWSAGCGSGEEPYTVAILWALAMERKGRAPELKLVATDIDQHLLDRAARACYPAGALRELPASWRQRAFGREVEEYCLREAFKSRVKYTLQDIRADTPPGRFDLILCRNLAFTYFDTVLQSRIAARLHRILQDGGVLLLGAHETIPEGVAGFHRLSGQAGFYQKHVD